MPTEIEIIRATITLEQKKREKNESITKRTNGKRWKKERKRNKRK